MTTIRISGKTLVSGDGDWDRPGDVKAWSTDTWKQHAALKTGGEVLCLAFAPDGKSLYVVVGDAANALAASSLLRDNGFLVVAIRPPTVPAGTARLRFAFTAQHGDDDIARLADIVRRQVLRR